MAYLLADDADDGACAVLGIEPAHGDLVTGLGRDLEGDVLLAELGEQTLEVDVEDALHGVLADGGERHNLGETAKELGTEVALHDLHEVVVCGRIAGRGEGIDDIFAADVRGEEDEGVGEVTHTAETVVQLALVEYLEEEVEDRLVGLLYLVEQHHGVGLLAYLVDEQSAFLIADVSRRGAVEQGDRVLFLEFGHVEAYQGRLVAEEEGGERLGEFGLSGSGRTEEEERAHGLALLVESGA